MSSHRHIRLLPIVALLIVAAFGNPLQAEWFEEVFDAPEPRWLLRAVQGDDEPEAEEELETDRDSFTFATNTVGSGRVLVESAYSFLDNRNGAESHSYPELITRIGLTERIEFRLGWNYEAGGGGSVTGADAGEEISAAGSTTEATILYGLKFALTEQESWVPESACILQGATPTAGPEHASQFVLGYAFGWTIFKDWKLDSAIRYGTTKEEDDQFNQWAPSIVLKVPVGEQWNAHVEYFGIFTDGRADDGNAQYVSPGVHYLLTPNCEVGVRVGWGLNQDAANFFSNVGVGLSF